MKKVIITLLTMFSMACYEPPTQNVNPTEDRVVYVYGYNNCYNPYGYDSYCYNPYGYGYYRNRHPIIVPRREEPRPNNHPRSEPQRPQTQPQRRPNPPRQAEPRTPHKP